MTELRIDHERVCWTVDGRAASADEAVRALASRPLVLLMHGFGSFEGDLVELARLLPDGVVCASPRAPLVVPPPVVNGFAWWPLRFGPDGLVVRDEPPTEFEGSGPHLAAVALLEWLDALDARVRAAGDPETGPGTGLGDIVPFGFSQGGCMATSLLRLRPERFVCAVNCSGFVAPGAWAGDAELAAIRPPMFWGRDPADPVIDAARIALTAEWAPAHTELEARLYHGVAHGIAAQEVADISAFVERSLARANGR